MNHDAWVASVRERINKKLASYFQIKLAEAMKISPESIELVEGIADLTMRGGKRLRPVVLDAAYRCVKPDGGDDITTSAGASIEVLQSYLLIHDDWMDQDDERRGGPAVHKIYEGRGHGLHISNALAILAGDLASAYALELMLDAPFPEGRRDEAYRHFVRIQKEVILGQHLDLTANADVSRMHDLKTGSYTVRGPLILGALLADASNQEIECLIDWANPIGEAFQLADDLLGTFGNEGETGKPGDDLRHKKRTCLVAETERIVDDAELGPIRDLMAAGEPSDAQVAAASELIISSGARKNVETRLTTLLDQAKAALKAAPFKGQGVETLEWLAERLAIRKD